MWYGVAAIPALTGIVQVFKSAFGFPDRWAGLLALVLGVVLGVAVSYALPEIDLGGGIAQGITVGLGASGIWSTSKNAMAA